MELITKHNFKTSETRALKIPGLLHDFEFQFGPYEGVDFSKLAFLFSGQGQMSPGLMKNYVENHPLFATRFKELDDFGVAEGLGQPSLFITDSKSVPSEKITLYRSLCLFTLQVSMFESLLFNQDYPLYLTGHSFGEFAVLVCSGMFKHKDMFRILLAREKAIAPTANQCVMFAVNKGSRVLELCSDYEIYLANQNTEDQASFVCRSQDFSAIKKVLKDQRIAAVPLEIAHPYHTPWMKEAKNDFLKRLGELKLSPLPPRVPWVSSVTGEIIDKDNWDPTRVIALMAEQLTTPVRFPRQLERITNQGVSHFIELSPIDVLIPMVEQVYKEAKAPCKTSSFRVRTKLPSAQKQSDTKLKESKIFGVINKALKSLTGYTFEDVQLEDRIREDLGIDSIKKAEIVFEVVNQMNAIDQKLAAPVNLAELATFSDILQYFDNAAVAQEKLSTPQVEKSEKFHVHARQWTPEPITDWRTGSEDRNVRHWDLQKSSATDGRPEDVLVLTNIPEPGEQGFSAWAEEWIEYFQKHQWPEKDWLFVHGGTAASNSLSVFLTTLALERKVRFKSIISDRPLNDTNLVQESFDFFFTDVRYIEGEREVRKLVVQEPDNDIEILPRSCIIFGGLGGVGKNLIQALPESVSHITIVGRRQKTDEIEGELAGLEMAGRTLFYRSLDVTNTSEVESFLGNIKAPQILIHSVGNEHSELLEKMDISKVSEIIGAKVTLGQCLHRYGQANPESLIVFNSSLISEFGNAGQAAYSLANRYLNELAEEQSNMVNFIWPAWDGVGMAKSTFITRSLKLQGLPSLRAEDGRELFHSFLKTSGNHFVIAGDFLPEYYAMNHTFSLQQPVFRTASRNRRLYLLSGITQNQMPYLTDHLIKKVCLFPASGSIGLMQYRYYEEFGRLAVMENFNARNFFVVAKDNSHHFLESIVQPNGNIRMEVKSSQVVADGELLSPSQRPKAQKAIDKLNYHLLLKDHLDESYAVYIGPKFKLQNTIYLNRDNENFILQMDMDKTHVYAGVPILDKVHKLVEFTFHAAGFRSLWFYLKTVLPKSVGRIELFEENFEDSTFYAVCPRMEFDSQGQVVCDLETYNTRGELVVRMTDFQLIEVGHGRSRDEYFDVIKESSSTQEISL